MKEIALTRGYVALVDDGDYEWLIEKKWSAVGYDGRQIYARHCWYIGPRKYGSVKMHRLIMGVDGESRIQVDHIDRNPLNNQRSNLRLCSSQQNSWNRRRKDTSSKHSRYHGVSWHVRDEKWVSSIRIVGRTIHLGNFDREADAALAYNLASARAHGQFAVLNEIPAAERVA